MEQVLLSTTILASFLGGIVALLAPCCVSVMLPAFFASSFRRRGQILGMTLVFAAGVGTIILPIALGAAIVSRALAQYHFWIFSVVGIAMVVVGVATLVGWKLMLPMPSGKSSGSGIGSVYGLGVFSGAASACCAPVLAGVAAMSGAASSISTAALVGVAYVFGMVAPLCVLALVWDRKDWSNSRLLTARTVSLWPGGRRLPLSSLLSGGLMLGMGVVTMIIAVRGIGMAPDGWQVRVTAWLNHSAVVIQQSIGFIPGWLSALVVFAALAMLVWKALRARRPDAGHTSSAIEPDATERVAAGSTTPACHDNAKDSQ
ncbi:cytochrome c biogenesis protein CcdA [Cryobacterium sp. SO2]|uniref:cytochrome c biogenesis CcdA family protein n=1 Tax=Cryobacterium sp. SO2 TaxID=1897060 RepID=UPI00223CE92A|nr:cytochrome c biogenesis protein CcdA [Cryobacterium sp. SO2]WEO76059.1 cytochrome c biogenesis protein CcdA [Cryobacterium sp. SO2]